MKFLMLPFLMFIYACERGEYLNSTEDNQITEQIKDRVFIKQNCDSISSTYFYIYERLPDWFVESDLFNEELIISTDYKIENRLNPLYLEGDFNGDGILDISLPIYEVKSNKKGLVIVHGNTNEIFIVGSGIKIRNGLSDDLNYIDIWRVNRHKVNQPGIEEESGNGSEGNLILKNCSIEILKSELGGGLIYWNGNGYSYFHQTC